MRGAIVTLDLETTGLNPGRDGIIEIGAVRSEDGIERAQFQSFVKPRQAIPPFIHELTGIDDGMVADAPRPSAILPELVAFVGDAPLLAHNAAFDMAFLHAGGVFREHPSLDSVELAMILLPNAPRYGLGSLTKSLGITLDGAHRALADARATSELYWRLWELALELPPTLLREILLGEDAPNWPLALFFEEVLVAQQTRDHKPSQMARPTISLIGAGERLLSTATLSEAFSEAMEEAAQTAGSARLLETGSAAGVLASMVSAAADWGGERGERVVLAFRDAASLQAAGDEAERQLGKQGGLWARLLAQEDYLCARSWSDWRSIPPLDMGERAFRARLLTWHHGSGLAERSALRLRGPLQSAWWRWLSARHCGAAGACCASDEGEACAWRAARARAESATIILTTQAAWWRDIATDAPPWPAYAMLVVGDANELEGSLTDVGELRYERDVLKRILLSLTHPRWGLLVALAKNGLHEDFAQPLRQSLEAFQRQADAFFAELKSVWEERSSGETGNSLWLSPERQGRPAFARARRAGQIVLEIGEAVRAALSRLAKGMEAQAPQLASINLLRGILAELELALAALRTGLNGEVGEVALWLQRTAGREGTPCWLSAPIRPGRKFVAWVAEKSSALVMQGASLGGGDGGAFLRDRLSLPATVKLRAPPREDEGPETLVYIPQDFPLPNERAAYQKALERGLLSLVSESSASLLALYTNYAQLRETSIALQPRLKLGGIPLFEADQTAAWLSADCGLLQMTLRDWWSASLPMGSLSTVLLARLPFDVPNFPLVAARTAEYGDGFGEFSLPLAIGRFLTLLRSAQALAGERVAFIVADNRLLSKRYGERFLDALPPLALRYGTSATLVADLQRWWEGFD